MNRIGLSMVTALALSACAPPQGSSTGADTMASPAIENRFATQPLGDVPPDNVLATDPAMLAGIWHTRPTAADPRLPDIVVTIDRERIVASSDCVMLGWTYRFTGFRLNLTRFYPVTCERELTADETRFADALGAATAAYHRGGRGLIFEGPRGRVVLFEHPPGMVPMRRGG